MNKNFQKIFAKAKSENRSCFVAFVTGMDPDYESSKKILIELSKYCDVIEVGVSFNTSTSDSSIIMSANDRAIESGARTEKIFQLIREAKKEITSDNYCILKRASSSLFSSTSGSEGPICSTFRNFDINIRVRVVTSLFIS